MGLKITDFFASSSYEDGETQIIVCTECLSHLCLSSLVISDKFWGLSGEAYLVDKLINVLPDHVDCETQMKTGIYVINKVRCQQCSTILGWMYKKSYSGSEAYKEGKYVIERKYIHLIPNNSATSILAEQAKILRRRRSSASISVSDDDSLALLLFLRHEIGSYDKLPISGSKKRHGLRATPILQFRDSIDHSLVRRSYLGDKDNFDEHEEDANVFVDA